jgi:2'-5' RNA ligase
MNSSNKSIVWTCFAPDSFNNPDDLHLTHKYLGKQSSENVELIAFIILRFTTIYRKQITPFSLVFDKEDFFGSNNSIRVLRPTTTNGYFHHPFASWSPQVLKVFDSLRSELGNFRPDDFLFNPHVTTKTDSLLNLEFTKYCLIVDDEIINFDLRM